MEATFLRSRKMRSVQAIVVLLLLGSGSFAHAATFTVCSTADVVDANPGNGTCAAASAAPALSTGLAMQFRSAGHVLGFTSEGILVAGRDHLLKVRFVGAAAAPEAPESASAADTANEPPASNDQGAAPLREVHYRNLWPGIDLRYDGKEGIVRSTYTIASGASVADIRLAYNVPLELTEEGTLTLRFATGTLHESTPIAWQEIEGT